MPRHLRGLRHANRWLFWIHVMPDARHVRELRRVAEEQARFVLRQKDAPPKQGDDATDFRRRSV